MSTNKIDLFNQVQQYYLGTQAAIEALTGIQEGAIGYATDINKPGSYDGATWTWGSTGAGHIIQDEGTPLAARSNLNFIGSGVTATDNAGMDSTDVTISSGGFTQEEIEDFVGDMVSGNTETGIDVTYDDSGGKLNFDAQTAGDLRYAPIAQGVTNGDTHDHVGGDGAQIDHGGLDGLGDDDHTQYHTDARGDARYAAIADRFPNPFALTNDITPTTLGSSVADYNPTGLSTADVLRLSSSTNVFIRGLAGASDGRIITILNVGTTYYITLLDEDGTNPTADNRFHFSETAGVDISIWPAHGMTVIYDATLSRWRPYTDRDAASLQGVPIALGLRDTLHDGYPLLYDAFQNVFLNDTLLDHNNLDNIGSRTHAQIDTEFDTNLPSLYAAYAKGVTNGDSHDHVGGDGAQIAYSGLSGLPTIREVLTGARTYYVRTDGNDSNTGLVDSAGGAFLTLARAVTAVQAIDNGGYNVTIQIQDGTYTAGCTILGWMGLGTLTIQGNSGTPDNVYVNLTGGTAFNIAGVIPSTLTIQNMKIVATSGGNGIVHGGSGNLSFGNINFGAIGNFAIYGASPSAYILATANWKITANQVAHLVANSGSVIEYNGKTITLTGTPAWGFTFAYVTRLSTIVAQSNTYSGSATGSRYVVDSNGVIYTAGAGATAFPGNVAGSASTGGQYL